MRALHACRLFNEPYFGKNPFEWTPEEYRLAQAYEELFPRKKKQSKEDGSVYTHHVKRVPIEQYNQQQGAQFLGGKQW